MDNAKVTILLATHNRAHLIRETLDSILAQTYTNWECIIIDDNSVDNTETIILEYIKRDNRFFYSKKTDKYSKGLGGTRNLGLDLACKTNSQFIQLFDDDDIMHPDKLTLQLDPMLRDENIDFTICQFNGFTNNLSIDDYELNENIPIESNNLPLDFLLSNVRINSLGPLFRGNLLREIRFREDLPTAEEREFFIRLFYSFKPKYYPVNKSLFFYRHHFNSITSNQEDIPNKLGTHIYINQILWDYLAANIELDFNTIMYFLKRFLYQNYNKTYRNKVLFYSKKSKNINFIKFFKIRVLISFHSLYIKLVYKIF